MFSKNKSMETLTEDIDLKMICSRNRNSEVNYKAAEKYT